VKFYAAAILYMVVYKDNVTVIIICNQSISSNTNWIFHS